jgi:hypothetical protein
VALKSLSLNPLFRFPAPAATNPPPNISSTPPVTHHFVPNVLGIGHMTKDLNRIRILRRMMTEFDTYAFELKGSFKDDVIEKEAGKIRRQLIDTGNDLQKFLEFVEKRTNE